MKINLKSSVFFLLSLVSIASIQGGGCISKNKQKAFKDSLLGRLPKEIANYILFLAEYQQMLDTRFVDYFYDYSGTKSYTKGGQYIARCKLPVGDFISHNDVYFYPLSISNDKSKILFGYLNLNPFSSCIGNVFRLYSCNPEIMKGRHFLETSAQLQKKFVSKLELFWESEGIILSGPIALSNDGWHIFHFNDEEIKVLKSVYSRYPKVIDLPSEIEPSEVRSIGYLDTFKQLCLITKAKHKPEKTTFIDLNQFDGSCPVDESENLLRRFVMRKK